ANKKTPARGRGWRLYLSGGGERYSWRSHHSLRDARGPRVMHAALRGAAALWRSLRGIGGVGGGAADRRVGQVHDLLGRLLELVERGSRCGNLRFERVEADVRARRSGLARLLDPRRDTLRVRRPCFFGQRRVLRLRFGGQ